MNILQENGNLILTNVKDFELCHIFECGQCFRWDKQSDNSYIGVAKGHALKIEQNNDTVFLYSTSLQDYNDVWKDYFDFDRDYTKIKKILSVDPILKNAIQYGHGIRLLQQDVWECIVSFIISASNNIPRIKKIVTSLCENFGEEINYMNNVYYSFPTPKKISSLTLDDLSIIKAGFRDKYILDAANKVFSNTININELVLLDSIQAKKILMSINGVGNKVSDCILLFGLSKYDNFPVDVWIKRIMEYCYFNNEQKICDIILFSQDKFGDLGGFAQQYLFFYARENKIDT